MKIQRVLPLILSILFMSLVATAQKNYTKDADQAFRSEEYFKAIELYKKASTKEKKKAAKAAIIFKIAESYRNINDMKQAEVWYTKAITAKYPDPIAILHLADAKKANGKYNEALTEYNNYKTLVPSDPRGEDGAKSSELAQKWKDNPTRYSVENVVQINSKYSDFSPAYADKKYNTIAFSSTREGSTGSEADPVTGENFSDVYETKVDKKGKWSTPVPLGEAVNSKINEGAVSINKKQTAIYFTRCDFKKNGQLGCSILRSEKKGTSWGDATAVKLFADTITVGHPAITKDEDKLFFASDMEGGQGGKDIWYVTYDKKAQTYGAPVNLGSPVNTPGDEMYPYVHDDGTLYFSSNGHLGMGGLDIFRADKSGDNFSNVTNLKFPLNSSADDFGIIFEGTKERGYLTSAREGGKGSDDIYSFVLPPLLFTLQGVIKDVDTQAPIAGATVKLVGSDGSSVEVKSGANGGYEFAQNGSARYVNPNTSYTVSAIAEKYLGDKGTFTTVGLEAATNFTKDLSLKSTKKGPIRLPDILYDLNKWDLKPQYQDSLNGLIQTLNDNPNIVIELGAHTDTRGTPKDNSTLSQKRAQSVVDYLISKGIDAERLQAKGYGESRPLINDKQIAAMKTNEEKEAAHQKNRRTEFRVVREDFVPKVDPNAPKVAPKIQDVSEEEEEAE